MRKNYQEDALWQDEKKLENTSLEEQLEYVEQEIRTKESDLKELRHKAKEIQKRDRREAEKMSCLRLWQHLGKPLMRL